MNRSLTIALCISAQISLATLAGLPAPAAGPAPAAKHAPIKPAHRPNHVKVPRVKGLTEASARKRIAAAGLKVQVVAKASKAKKGIVIAQHPAGQAKPGSTISITVSQGNALVKVPNIHGVLEPDPILAKLGLKGKRISIHGPIESDAAGMGEAYRQHPKAGTMVPRGTTVTYHSWWEAS